MSRPDSRHRLQFTLAALAGVVVIAGAVIGGVVLMRDSGSSPTAHRAAAGTSSTSHPASTSATTHSSPAAASSTSSGPTRKVRVTSAFGDGAEVGIGEPIVLSFSPTPTDSSAFTHAVKVTVDGRPATGAWYWEKPYRGQPVQAHFRQMGFWPPHARIAVSLPIAGLSAGKGLSYSGGLTSLSIRTGAAHVSVVNAQALQMTVTSDGKLVHRMPVSLGAASTPTYNGTKIVMQKGEDVPGTGHLRANGTVLMSGPGYSGDPVPWSVRVTASGEYVHAAGWNTHIGTRSTSNGCTNLRPADGEWFYHFSLLGDVVKYVGTDGTEMRPLDGLGDWNIGWSDWAGGGLLRNH